MPILSTSSGGLRAGQPVPDSAPSGVVFRLGPAWHWAVRLFGARAAVTELVPADHVADDRPAQAQVERFPHPTVAAPTSGQRLVVLDLLRGYFLFVMVVDHLERFPGLFELLTGRGRLWASAAEGFFFISGMVVAIVRNRDARTLGFRQATLNIWKRAWTLYIWSVGLTVLYTYIAFALGEEHMGVKRGVIGHVGFLAIFAQSALLQYSYGWTDFLPHYVIFMLIAPLALWLLRSGLWAVVAFASAGAWMLFSQFAFRWQVLFFAGMTVGFHLPAIESRFSHLSKAIRDGVRAAVLGLAAATLVASASVIYLQPRLAAFGLGIAVPLERWNARLAPYFDKGLLPWPRLMLFGLWFAAIYLLCRRFEAVVMRRMGWFLLPLGRSSLYAYILHSLLVLATGVLIPHPAGWIGNVVICGGVLWLIWFCTVRGIGMGIIPR